MQDERTHSQREADSLPAKRRRRFPPRHRSADLPPGPQRGSRLCARPGARRDGELELPLTAGRARQCLSGRGGGGRRKAERALREGRAEEPEDDGRAPRAWGHDRRSSPRFRRPAGRRSTVVRRSPSRQGLGSRASPGADAANQRQREVPHPGRERRVPSPARRPLVIGNRCRRAEVAAQGQGEAEPATEARRDLADRPDAPLQGSASGAAAPAASE